MEKVPSFQFLSKLKLEKNDFPTTRILHKKKNNLSIFYGYKKVLL